MDVAAMLCGWASAEGTSPSLGRRAGSGWLGEMLDEPVAGQASDGPQRAGLLEQVGGAWHDGEPVLALQLLLRLPVQAEHDLVAAANNEKRRGLHVSEPGVS